MTLRARTENAGHGNEHEWNEVRANARVLTDGDVEAIADAAATRRARSWAARP